MANNKGFKRLLARPKNPNRSLTGLKTGITPPTPTVSPAMTGKQPPMGGMGLRPIPQMPMLPAQVKR